jgi:hypothetical protein
LTLRNFATIKFSTNGYPRLLVALILAALAVPLFVASAFGQQTSYVDPSLGTGDSIIRSDVFVGDKQGRVPAKEGFFTRQLSGWLSGNAEVLNGVVVHVGRGCIGDTYLADPAGKIALIIRGGCTFVEKITRAYNAGAIGAIVYNNTTGTPCCDNLVSMAPTSVPPLVPIPGFFVGNSAGVTLSATPVTVKIQAASFKALNDAVTALLLNGTLNNQEAGALKDTISAASNAANAGHFAKAVNLMEQFQTEITSLYNGGSGVLPLADFNALNDAANNIITRLTEPYTGFSI